MEKKGDNKMQSILQHMRAWSCLPLSLPEFLVRAKKQGIVSGMLFYYHTVECAPKQQKQSIIINQTHFSLDYQWLAL